MHILRWLMDCAQTIIISFKNSLIEPRAGEHPRTLEDFQERERQTALRDVEKAKNQPDESGG
jgi:hypothetical protein